MLEGAGPKAAIGFTSFCFTLGVLLVCTLVASVFRIFMCLRGLEGAVDVEATCRKAIILDTMLDFSQGFFRTCAPRVL
jgi:hypothetical protein